VPVDVTAGLRPADEQLRSPAWWVDQALREARRVAAPKARSRNLWSVGVAAFDSGQFGLAMEIMATPDLDEQDRSTIGFRLTTAYRQAGDVQALEALSTLVTGDLDRQSVAEAIAEARRIAAGLPVDVPLVPIDPANVDPNDPDVWVDAIRVAEAGNFIDAVRIAGAAKDASGRAYALGEIATLQSRSDPDGAKATFKLGVAALHARTEDERNDGDVGAVREVATAAATLGDVDGALAVLRLVPEQESRDEVAQRIANLRARAGDVAFTRAVMGFVGGEARSRDWARALHVTACLTAGLRDEAEHTALGTREPYARFYAYKRLAISRAAADDWLGYDLAVRSARDAMRNDDESTQWAWSSQRQLAMVQTFVGRTRDVWASVIAESDPARRVTLMTAAVDGLLHKLRGTEPEG
jgi:hypothetical protein